MIPKVSGRWILLGILSLFPIPTVQAGPGQASTPKPGMEDASEFPESCGVTFHAPPEFPCGTPGDPADSRRELRRLRDLLEASGAALRELAGNGTAFRDVVSEAVPAIREAHLEFRESLENVRRELEEHAAREERPEVVRKKEELRKGVRLLSHVLLLTARLAQSLEGTAQSIHARLGLPGTPGIPGIPSLRSEAQP